MLDAMSRAIETLSSRDVLFADIRHEVRSGARLLVVNRALRRFDRTNKAGTVARVLVGECWGQASTTQAVSVSSLKELLSEALQMAKAGAKYSKKRIEMSDVRPLTASVHQKLKEDPRSVKDEEKLSFLMELDKEQRIDERVVNTNSVYEESRLDVKLSNSVGSRLEWDEVRVRAVVQSVAREGSKVQSDYGVKDGLAGYELVRGINASDFAGECAHGAVDLLSAEKPPSGEMTVVTDGDIAGLIAHEVCGHASEADEVVKGRSFLTGLVGVRVASDAITLVDDGTIEGLRGTVPFDSEGTQASRTEIINRGEYRGYLHTLETSARMGVRPTGNGRAQDYNHRVFARMTNTYFDAGEWANEEIFRDTKEGLYVVRPTSGMEDVVGGGVQCLALKGYIIKNGELSTLVRGMALTGRVLDILKTVDAVGNSLQFSGGTCGKGEEDYIPVSSGGPHMRARMVVGGG